jgi:REP element-mobilizing transposase RayT
MSTHLLQDEVHQTYFCTITCHRWLQLFKDADAYTAVYNWFTYLEDHDKCAVAAYVIMPNHLHALIHYRNENKPLNKIVGEGKRFMAYNIVNRLKKLNHINLLKVLSEDVLVKERAKGKKHEVFRSHSDIRICYTRAMIEQKLDYIHHNPVSGKWNLVDDYLDYEHSSALFYEKGIQRHFKVTHYLGL